MSKKNCKTDIYEKIAAESLIELKGVEWVSQNLSDLCSWVEVDVETVKVVFGLTSKLPSEEEIITNDNLNCIPNGCVSFVIDKTDKSCKLEDNLLDM